MSKLEGGYKNSIKVYVTSERSISLVIDPYGEEGQATAFGMSPSEALQLARRLIEAALRAMGANSSDRISLDDWPGRSS